MKQFEICHERSSNKVGVDGVLIGAWTPVEDSMKRILDAGCGCGLISLMIAQRLKDARIVGIDIEPDAVEEAGVNVRKSEWADRIEIQNIDFMNLVEEFKNHSLGNYEGFRQRKKEMEKFDLIISNPPFFDSGIDASGSKRMTARHIGSLSPENLVKNAKYLLRQEGSLSFITTADNFKELLVLASQNNLIFSRLAFVKGTPGSKVKRVMLNFVKSDGNTDSPYLSEHEVEEETIIIESERGKYTEDYIKLCRPFYTIFP